MHIQVPRLSSLLLHTIECAAKQIIWEVYLSTVQQACSGWCFAKWLFNVNTIKNRICTMHFVLYNMKENIHILICYGRKACTYGYNTEMRHSKEPCNDLRYAFKKNISYTQCLFSTSSQYEILFVITHGTRDETHTYYLVEDCEVNLWVDGLIDQHVHKSYPSHESQTSMQRWIST